MPSLGDTVEVDISIHGVTVFQKSKGTVVAASPSEVEVAVPLLHGVWQMKQPPSAFTLVSPRHWSAQAHLKMT